MADSPAASADDLVARMSPDVQIIVPLANGEPPAIIDALERRAEAGSLHNAAVHQMHALFERPYLDGRYGTDLRHRSYFLSHVTRPHFHSGGLDLVPAHFSEVPFLLRSSLHNPVVAAAATLPDRHGYFSLGTNADYTASFIGRVPFFLEANEHMPRTSGRSMIHRSQVAAWIRNDRPLIEVPPAEPDDLDRRIAMLVAERISDRACIQAGIGKIPNAVLALLSDKRDLGIHTELLSDGFVDLIEAGAVTNVFKRRRPNVSVTTFALGTQRVYDFLDDDLSMELLPVDWVNDPRVIAQQSNLVSINATTEIDFLGQAASETIAGRYYSGSGGQTDFARGAMFAPNGQGFLALRSVARGQSRIVPRLSSGSVVSTLKNTVDKVVTEHGVAEFRGRSIRERTKALIAIADPQFRDELSRSAREMGYL